MLPTVSLTVTVQLVLTWTVQLVWNSQVTADEPTLTTPSGPSMLWLSSAIGSSGAAPSGSVSHAAIESEDATNTQHSVVTELTRDLIEPSLRPTTTHGEPFISCRPSRHRALAFAAASDRRRPLERDAALGVWLAGRERLGGVRQARGG